MDIRIRIDFDTATPQLRGLVDELRDGAPRPARASGRPDEQVDPELARRLGKLAARAEEIAATLENP